MPCEALSIRTHLTKFRFLCDLSRGKRMPALGVAVVALPIRQISDDRDAYEGAVEIVDPKWADIVVTREFRHMIC